MSLYGKAKDFDSGSGSVFKFGKPGDEIAGEVIDYQVVNTQFGNSPLLQIREERTHVVYKVYGGKVVLRRRLEELRPEAQDQINILFEGEGEKGVKLFRVYLERNGEPVLATPSGNSATPHQEEDAATDAIPF